MAERLVEVTPWLTGLAQVFAPTRRTKRSRKRTQAVVSELSLHRTVADFLKWTVLDPVVWTTIPAGWGKLHPATAGMLKACGLQAGMPDIMIFMPGRVFGIELKVGHNKASSAQQVMASRLAEVGIMTYLARSVDDVKEILQKQNVPMRNTT